MSQSLADSLHPIYFTNRADELDGDESGDVAVIVVYNNDIVAVMSDQHVLTAGDWSSTRPALPCRPQSSNAWLDIPPARSRLIAVVDSYHPATTNSYRYLSNRLITAFAVAMVRASCGATGLSAAPWPTYISPVICGPCALTARQPFNGLYSFVLQTPADKTDNGETNK